jgi:hypothetical protein
MFSRIHMINEPVAVKPVLIANSRTNRISQLEGRITAKKYSLSIS